MKNLNLRFFYSLLAICVVITLSSFQKNNESPNTLTQKEKNAGWSLLFDGKSTNGWHLYNKKAGPTAWGIKNGELFCNPENKNEAERGDLLTDKEYENYELKFEWKISEGGNSGVFINVIEKKDVPTAWASGPEYQLLENTHADYAKPKSRAGCLYNFSAVKNPVEPKAAGQWNQSVIKQKNGKIEFYLNGVLTATEDFKSQGWKDKINETWFKSFPEFGKYTKGHIALQDWNKGISFRNIKIRQL
jgi:hypothetical protein